jgi:hypothetical protein
LNLYASSDLPNTFILSFFLRGGKAYPFFINKEKYLQNRTENERKKKKRKKEENAEAFKKKSKMKMKLISLYVGR